ncbi:hypothetical protein ACH5RR_000724 [Cinchona calisaya]|uniref:Retrovirus-related Pol polyprotein from transposon TNT 1-94-like beta-barrel domain-containing protein n=1 Tax=Cinchona calisaya TaxID=153742 RepID=A0ABD3B214_9GENT
MEQILKSNVSLKDDGGEKSQKGRGRGHGQGQGGRGRSNQNNANDEDRSQRTTRDRGRGKGRGNNRRSNEGRYDTSNIECHNCHKYWHYSLECLSASKKEQKANLVDNKQETEEPTLLLVVKHEERDGSSTWYLDNGVSNHMCGYKEKFVELDEKVNGYVSFRDSSNPNTRKMNNINFFKGW